MNDIEREVDYQKGVCDGVAACAYLMCLLLEKIDKQDSTSAKTYVANTCKTISDLLEESTRILEELKGDDVNGMERCSKGQLRV